MDARTYLAVRRLREMLKSRMDASSDSITETYERIRERTRRVMSRLFTVVIIVSCLSTSVLSLFEVTAWKTIAEQNGNTIIVTMRSPLSDFGSTDVSIVSVPKSDVIGHEVRTIHLDSDKVTDIRDWKVDWSDDDGSAVVSLLDENGKLVSSSVNVRFR